MLLCCRRTAGGRAEPVTPREGTAATCPAARVFICSSKMTSVSRQSIILSGSWSTVQPPVSIVDRIGLASVVGWLSNDCDDLLSIFVQLAARFWRLHSPAVSKGPQNLTGIRQRGGTYQVRVFDARSGDGKQVVLTDSSEAEDAEASSEIKSASRLRWQPRRA